MSKSYQPINALRSEEGEELQKIIDALYKDQGAFYTVRRIDVITLAESNDICRDLLNLVELLPPGEFTREKLCAQINSSINGHAWGQVYGTVQ